MVVLPAASRPTIRIRISFFAKSLLNSFVNVNPILPIDHSSLIPKEIKLRIIKFEKTKNKNKAFTGIKNLSNKISLTNSLTES